MPLPSNKCSEAELKLIHADFAWDLLRSVQFIDSWSRLARACPWSTACQSWEFADAWLSTYQEFYDPLFVVQYDEVGRLIGLLPLVVSKETGSIEHVGAGQAEYQVWLATESNANNFIELALDELAKAYPGRRLRLRYLPPGSPTAWCAKTGRWGSRSLLYRNRRPLLTLGPNSPTEISLRKKTNKSRINRLKKSGSLSLITLETKEQLEEALNTIADYYDLRHGAIHSSTPFKNDPLKREFYLRMMENSGLVHASILMAGDTLAAANIGLINRTSVDIGVIAFSPFLAEHSPAKIHILMLARELGQQGFRDLDLTAGGDEYKNRSADHYDEVYVLNICFDQFDNVRHTLALRLRSTAKGLLGERGKSVAIAVKYSRRAGLRYALMKPLRSYLRQDAVRNQESYIVVSPETAKRTQSGSLFRVNCISDLLCYEPTTQTERSKSEFLSNALQRLQSGERAYTFVESGILLHCAWVRPPGCGIDIQDQSSNSLSEHYLLWDDYTHPQAVKRNLANLSREQRIYDAANFDGVKQIVVELSSDQQRTKSDFAFVGADTLLNYVGRWMQQKLRPLRPES